MSGGRTAVLGGGFGGITVATTLAETLGPDHEVVLVDRAESFSMGLRKLWELVGHATIADGSRRRATLADRGIEVLREDVREIDPAGRAATTDSRTLVGDQLVVALGAVPRPDLVAGLAEHGHVIWDVAGVPAAAEALAALEGGRILILIAGAPYPCPPAPYECAFHLDQHLSERGIRDRCAIEVATVQPILMPNAGREGSAWMAERLGERGIETRAGSAIDRVESGRVVLEDGEVEFDLLIAVPPHRVPEVVAASGLTGESGWVAVDPGTLETAHPGVYAIGDCTAIKLANGLPLPKAGIISEREGERVAAAIVAEVRGDPAPPPFDGRGQCFIEMGTDLAALVEGEFFAEPEPLIEIAPPDPSIAARKRAFESERLERWFGG